MMWPADNQVVLGPSGKPSSCTTVSPRVLSTQSCPKLHTGGVLAMHTLGGALSPVVPQAARDGPDLAAADAPAGRNLLGSSYTPGCRDGRDGRSRGPRRT